jgi:hypothetical protein
MLWKQKILLPLPVIKSGFLGRQMRSLGSVSTELSGIHINRAAYNCCCLTTTDDWCQWLVWQVLRRNINAECLKHYLRVLPGQKHVDLHIQSPIRLQGVVLNLLSTGTTFAFFMGEFIWRDLYKLRTPVVSGQRYEPETIITELPSSIQYVFPRDEVPSSRCMCLCISLF